MTRNTYSTNITAQSLNIEKEPTDIIGWLLNAIHEKDTSASPTRESLSDDTRAVIIAGRYAWIWFSPHLMTPC